MFLLDILPDYPNERIPQDSQDIIPSFSQNTLLDILSNPQIITAIAVIALAVIGIVAMILIKKR